MTVGALDAPEELGLIYKDASANLLERTRKAVDGAMEPEITQSAWRRPIVVTVPVGDGDQADPFFVLGGHYSHLVFNAGSVLPLAVRLSLKREKRQ
jgi:hypothetical protein